MNLFDVMNKIDTQWKSLAHKIAVYARLSQKIVPRMGFEPMISALKGRRPRPLDERGMLYLFSNTQIVLHLDATVKQIFVASHLER